MPIARGIIYCRHHRLLENQATGRRARDGDAQVMAPRVGNGRRVAVEWRAAV